jgi:hypothetical protein
MLKPDEQQRLFENTARSIAKASKEVQDRHIGNCEKRFLEAPSLLLVIPTGAQRSGGTCGSPALSWKCFSTEDLWAFGPLKRMKMYEHRPDTTA